MPSPYQILGISEQSSDAEIKLAYLERVKDYPPDRDQNRFMLMQQAYETIKDQDSRLRYELFQLPEIDFDDLLDRAFMQDQPLTPLCAEDFLQILKSISAEKLIPTYLPPKL